MNREQQDYVWHKCLPKEYREEVKKNYRQCLNELWYVSSYFRGRMRMLRELFGERNLTSDADEKGVDIAKLDKMLNEALEKETADSLKEWMDSKREPMFKEGEEVRWRNKIVKIDAILNRGKYFAYNIFTRDGNRYCIAESDLEPYIESKDNEGKKAMKMKPIESKVSVYLATAEEDEEFRSLLHENGFKWGSGQSLKDRSYWSEGHEYRNTCCLYPRKIVTYCGAKTPNTLTFSEFKEQYFEAEPEETSRTKESCCSDHPVVKSEMVDSIIKDSFRNERRLNIATQILSGIVASSKPCKHPVKRAIELTDALIDECEKGGKS